MLLNQYQNCCFTVWENCCHFVVNISLRGQLTLGSACFTDLKEIRWVISVLSIQRFCMWKEWCCQLSVAKVWSCGLLWDMHLNSFSSPTNAVCCQLFWLWSSKLRPVPLLIPQTLSCFLTAAWERRLGFNSSRPAYVYLIPKTWWQWSLCH